MSGKLIRQRLLATTTVAGAVLLAMPAFAQDTTAAPIAPAAENPSPSTPAPRADDGPVATGNSTANSGGDIVVTGSRIPHPELESASPVTVVGAQEVAVTGVTRTEDLLNSLPQVFADQGGSIANGATGIATVNLRNLGAQRSLVLINGRRLVPGDPRTPYSDINIIPAALIKRVDVLTGGASSVYGADAVAGVVNFVMDTEFDGFKLDGQYSLYQHENDLPSNGSIVKALQSRNYGYPKGSVADGGAVDVTAVIGAGFDDGRGHVTAYGNYRKINAVTQNRRDYSSCSLSGNTPSAIATSGRYFNCGGSGTSAPGTFYTYTAPGAYQVQGNQFVPGRTLYNFAPTNYFQRPDERYTAGFFAHYDVSDAFKPYMEFMFMDDRTVAQIAPSGDFQNTTTINCDNPLLSAQQLGLACADGNLVGQGGVAGATATTFTDALGNSYQKGILYALRRNVEGGPRQDDLQHTTYRGVFGAKGDVFKGVSYEAYYQYSRVNFAETYRNDFGVTRLGRAVDVVTDPTSGAPVCRSVLDGTDPACVPYNIFTTGGVTQAALNYLQIPLFQRGQTTEQIANASVTLLGSEYGVTSPFATEGFALNFGGEYRKETLNLEVDTNFLAGEGAGQGGPTTPVQGQLKVTEGFVEASLPLVQDRPFFETLLLGAGYRRSHYEVNGNGTQNQFDTDTWKVEATWAPVRDLKLRASFNRAVRAPNVVELYAAQSVALDGSTDPCAGPTPSLNGVPLTQAQCALTGVTAAQFGNIRENPASQYNGLQGGNPNLTPEIAYSLTAGVVITPTFLRGFQATVDYFDIKLKNQVGVIGADTIIEQCLTNGSYCGQIHRNAGGSLWTTPDGYIEDTNLNAGRIQTRGIDVTLGYTQELGSYGNLGLSLVGTYLDKFKYSPVGSDPYECAGVFGTKCGTPSPRWRHKFRSTYTMPSGPSVSAAWRYFDPVNIDSAGTAAPGNAHIRAQSYFDLALTAPVADKFSFQVGVNNILDRDPPINGLQLAVYENGNTFPQVYDALGRYVFAGATLNF